MKTELGFIVKSPAPAVKVEFVTQIIGILQKAEDWRTKRQIAEKLGVAYTPAFERKLRLVAESAAPRVVSYPGSPGLKHWNFATVVEIHHAISAHESQGGDHYRRANAYRCAYHSRFRVPSVELSGQLALSP